MSMRRLISSLLAATLLLAGCGGAKSTDAPAAPAPAPAPVEKKLTPMSIRLDWTPNGLHAPIYAAQAQGFYKEAGIELTINPASDKDDVLKLVDTGIDSVGLYYQSSVIRSQAKGYNVRAFGAYVQHPLNVILVDDRAGVKSLKDLEGKTVGFTSDPTPKGGLSTTAASLKLMVEKAGGDFSKIKLVNVGDAGVQALATQKVQALGGVYEYHEKFLLDRESIKTTVFRLHEHGAPDFYELVLVTSEKFATENPALLTAFLKATEKGVQYAGQNPAAAADLLLKVEPILKKELVQNAITVVLPLFRDGNKPFGTHERARWESAATWMMGQGLVKELPNFDKLLVK